MKTNLQLFQNTKLKLPPIPKGCFELFEDKDSTVFAIADENSYLHLFQYSIPNLQFKSIYKSDPHQSAIASLTISDDLLFFNTGPEIRALTKKGKQVYKHDTCLAESVQKIIVSGYKLYVIGATILNQFSMADAKLSNNKSRRVAPSNKHTIDVAMFVSEDDIMDVILYQDVVKEYCVVLRSNNQIQIVDQQKAVVSYKTEGVPLCVSHFDEGTSQYLVGLSTGTVVCLMVESKSNSLSLKEVWKISSNDRKVTGVMRFPKGLIVCRSNEFEIWASEESQFQRIWKKSLKEAGSNFKYITQTDQIIYTSLNGEIVALSNYQKQIKQNRSKADETKSTNQKIQRQIQLLIEERNKLGVKKEVVSKHKIKHTLILNQILRCWVLDISSSVPINNVVFDGFNSIQCQYSQQYKSGNTDAGEIRESQVFSMPSQNDLQFQIYVQDGVEKTGQVFISFDSNPPQSTSIPLQLKPLNLYYKISNTITASTISNWHKLSVTGSFNLSQANIWLLSIFNQTVKQLPESQLQIVYESIITKQNIAVRVSHKTIEISSESVNPLIVLKKYIQMRAKEKEVSITVDIYPNQIALEESLKKLQPEFLKFQKLHRENKILSQLIQLEKEVEELNQSFKDMIGRKEQISREYTQSLGVYETLKSSLLAMYINYKGLRNQRPSEFQLDNFTKKVGAFNLNQLRKLIL